MVRSREVTHYSSDNGLAQGAGDKVHLKDNGNFELCPHLSDLIARLERATGPDRRLDSDLELFAFPQRSFPTPHYTASIDAALTLVPEPWRVCDIWQADHGSSWHAGVRKHGTEVGTDEMCANPAIALCIAALKARNDK